MRALTLLAAALAMGTAAQAQVHVTYREPLRFTEFAGSPARLGEAEGWLAELQGYIERQGGARLPAGQQLAVTVTDLRRAGWVDPMFRPGQPVRVVRDIDAPRMDLRFRLTDASGAVLREGDAKLRDLGFLSRPQRPGPAEALTHEKNLVDRWLDEVLGRAS